MNEEEHPIVSSSNGLSDEKGSMEEDEADDDVDIPQHPPPEAAPEAVSGRLHQLRPVRIPATMTLLRRLQPSRHHRWKTSDAAHPPERLVYPTAVSSANITAKRVKGMGRTAETARVQLHMQMQRSQPT